MKSMLFAALLGLAAMPAFAGNYAECLAEAEANGHWGPEEIDLVVQAKLDECSANGYWDEVRAVGIDRAFQVYCAMPSLN